MNHLDTSATPRPAHESPPLSPAVAQDSSTRTSPLPEPLQNASLASSTFTPVLTERPSSHEPQRSTEMGRGSGVFYENHDKNTRSSTIQTAASSAPTLPQLIGDVSQYTGGYRPSDVAAPSSTTLAELAHLVRLQSYQDQKRSQSRVKLHRCLVSNALAARLARCGDLAQKTLVDHLKSDDKKGFAVLYNAVHDVRNSCDATRRYALLEPDLDFGKQKTGADNIRGFSTFLNEIPSTTRAELLRFISRLRTNPDFLATRIARLYPEELETLSRFYRSSAPAEPSLASIRRANPLFINKKPQSNSPSAVERLLSFQRHDPLSALMYTIFANSTGPDSSDDIRRLQVWSTTCAKLINEAKGSEAFMCTIFDAWAGMREWSGKTSLELCLMRLLHDGAFLLEPENQQKRGKLERNTKNDIAAEEFFDRAVESLFEVLDDEPNAGGIPEGALELGSAILKKIETLNRRRGAEIFILYNWFFRRFLLNAITYPEQHGIMIGHHISELARQQILRVVHQKACLQVHHVSSANPKEPTSVLPKIRSHIENLFNRFRLPRPYSSYPVLHPARSITSPRETFEVQPFLVISPADITTLVTTLFPERKGVQTPARPINGVQSSSSSIISAAGTLQNPPSFASSPTMQDAASMLSASVSSLGSTGTSNEPLLPPGDRVSSKSPSDETKTTEEYGAKLRTALKEMNDVLGPGIVSGTCHPCAERWAVLFVSKDGKELLPRLKKDWDEDDDEDSFDSDSEEDDGELSVFGKEYYKLKNAVVKLVEDYEIPKVLAPDSESKEFSNRPSVVRKEAKQASKGKKIAAQDHLFMPSHPKLGQGQLSVMLGQHKPVPPPLERLGLLKDKEPAPVEQSVLLTMVEAAMSQCIARSDFISAHLYHETLQRLKRLPYPSLKSNGYGQLLNHFSRGYRDSISKSAVAIEEFEAWFVWLTTSQERHDGAIERLMLRFNELRDKTWYVTDVRHSAAYEEARNVALALKIMGEPLRPDSSRQTAKKTGLNKPVNNNFLLKTESQVLDLIAAPSNQGGPNKLSDEQSDITATWLAQCGIENFCKGEERIHRFCREMDKCVNQLVGNSILDGPVLWSSVLYSRDHRILESNRQKGDLYLTSVGTLSMSGEEELDSEGRSMMRSLDFVGRPQQTRDLRTASLANKSQQSLNSMNSGASQAILDKQDIYGLPNSFSIDVSTTFWSPFQVDAGSDARSGPVPAKNDSGYTMKKRFLLDLKQTLLGLLLSDLGTLVWSTGSETDDWFFGDLGQKCLQRSSESTAPEHQEPQQYRQKEESRYLPPPNPLLTLGSMEKGPVAPPVATLQHAGSFSRQLGLQNAAEPRNPALSAVRRAGLMEFPYNKAYRRLLRKFSTHPNPFIKLHALYELQVLIVASLMSRSGRSLGGRREVLPTAPDSPSLGALGDDMSLRSPAVAVSTAKNIDEAIANCNERRSHVIASNNGNMSPIMGSRSPDIPGTDDVVEILRDLFKDPLVCPKTLFRDLQFVAAFVPAQILDRTDRGKAFWDAGLAALGLKQDVCQEMVELADQIVAYHNTDKHRTDPERLKIDFDGVSLYTMEDAARMWLITAKEGDPTAERELATFYLTSPNLLPRAIQPLARPKDIFRPEIINKKNEDPMKNDPAMMCVAYHWMELSAHDGDELAKKYIKSQDILPRDAKVAVTRKYYPQAEW